MKYMIKQQLHCVTKNIFQFAFNFLLGDYSSIRLELFPFIVGFGEYSFF